MSQTFDIKVRFRTAQPLSQEAGMRFWEYGSHFAALPGRATYQLVSRGDAESMVDAVMGLCMIVDRLVAEDIPRWPDVVYVGSSVDLVAG